ncbi:TonB-dependent receptor [Spirosoma utsteinense]|uniref:Iron complex outermembrane receptor protein n=2 Tax=Spirosoma utsteinense TaxID=2585773 RepID=A0ABR6W0E1_9BACT|nr:iron complex outermembrane receptor protein [Spirosoma utsteinense]MBC3789598.1 iron complex outermembrane receptor protein [Spirosoma utsteinense]
MIVGLLAGSRPMCRAQTACTTVLAGRILSADTYKPLTGATVTIRQLTTGAVADTAGYFRLSGVCPGNYTVEYQFLGYKSLSQPVTVGSDSVVTMAAVALPVDNQTLQEVIVTDRRSEAQKLLQVQTALSGSALDATRGQSLGESLKGLPGLYAVQTGPSISKPVIHGLYSNRIVTLNNGVRQEDQQWGSEHAPQIDPFLATRLTVIKGAASIRYGSDAIGGVILVEPKAMPSSPGFGGEVNVVAGTNGGQGVVSGYIEQALKQIAGLSWRLQGTLKRVGYARTPDYYLENSSYRENNLSGTVAYNRRRGGAEVFYSQFNTHVGLFTGAQVGSLADFYAAIARPEPLSQPGFSYDLGRPYQHVQHDLLKFRAFLRSERWGTVTVTIARQQNVRREYDVLAFSRSTDPELYLKLVTQTADLVWEQEPVKLAGRGQLSGSVGLSGITQGNVRRFLFLIPNYRNYGLGVFAMERYATARWTVEAGIRYDYRWLRAFFLDESTNAVTARTRDWRNTTGSLGVTYQANQHLTVSGNLSTAWRAPNVSDLYSDGLHQSAVAYERGNPDLKPEQALNTNLSLEYTGQRFYADIGLYTNQIDNYIYLKPDSVPIVRQRGTFPAYSYSQVLASFRGVDATIRYKLTDRLTLSSRTSILFAYDRTNHSYLVYIPPNRTDNSLRYAVGQMEASARKRLSGLYVSLTHNYVARQNRVPAVTQRQENGQVIFTGDFAPPPAAYSLVGAEVGFAWRVIHRPLTVILTGTNLFNRAYRDYLDRFRYFADEPGRNLILKLKLPLGL